MHARTLTLPFTYRKLHRRKNETEFVTGYSYLWSTRASNPFWCRLRLLLTLVHCVGWGVKRFRSNLIKVPREKKESEQQIVMGS